MRIIFFDQCSIVELYPTVSGENSGQAASCNADFNEQAHEKLHKWMDKRFSGNADFQRLPAWAGLAYVSLFRMLIGFIFWYRGLAQGGIATVGQLQLLQPFFSMLVEVSNLLRLRDSRVRNLPMLSSAYKTASQNILSYLPYYMPPCW